jgi:hypothetical protein
VNVVTDLFPFVSKDAVGLSLKVALYQIAEKPMQLDAGMVRAGKAAAT